MDMYKKRKMRKENTNINENNNGGAKTNINWYIPPYGKPHSNPYK